MRNHTLDDNTTASVRMRTGANNKFVCSCNGVTDGSERLRTNLAVWPSPSGPQSRPYGLAFAKGAIWYSESFAKPNTIVRFDPTTEKFQSWAIPGGGDIVRNMSVTRDGNPVTANSLVNQVGLVEVK